ncbi:hypothetical protein DRJ25_03910, partial [Candidatus Woesearchaeota archaeon]
MRPFGAVLYLWQSSLFQEAVEFFLISFPQSDLLSDKTCYQLSAFYLQRILLLPLKTAFNSAILLSEENNHKYQ